MSDKSTYYSSVGKYYDFDANEFDERYWRNQVLQYIRQQFREEVVRHDFANILEIGYGTGLDMVHFATVFPDVQVYGLDISDEMWRITAGKIEAAGLRNARAEIGSVEDIHIKFPNTKYDLIYVFFGALNTVQDLDEAARILRSVLNPGGLMVLSFVNKWYLMGMAIEMLKLRFRAAFSRVMPIWGGYSPNRYLPSRCYTPRRIKKAFSGMRLLRSKGFSILHPAWYYHGLNRIPRRLHRVFWKMDDCLNRTPCWSLGEYTLFVFRADL